jgi:hypothetical protein
MVRPWAKHPRVTVKCSKCRERRTLAQVEDHNGILHWHAEGWFRLPKPLREERGEAIPATFACFLPVAEVRTALPASGFAVICPKHHDPNADFAALGDAVLSEVARDARGSVIFFPTL